MTDVVEIQDKVRAFIVESFLTEADAAQFRNDDDLLTLLDSLEILRTVVALESSFSIKVLDCELSVENLGSVERMAAFLARKLQPRLEPQTNPTAACQLEQGGRHLAAPSDSRQYQPVARSQSPVSTNR